MFDMEIVKLRDNTEINNAASAWFHSKWKVPAEAYLQSMEECRQTTADGFFTFRDLSKRYFPQDL